MVIENFNHTDSTFSKFQPKHSVAIFKRLLSALLDYFILAPIVFFISMTFLKNGVSLFKQFPQSAEAKEVVFHVCLLSLVLFALIQTIFIYFFKGTPGQTILKIQVEFSDVNYSRFLQILVRQLGFVISPVLLGLPWLAVIYHPQGKTFYERLSDSQLFSFVPNDFDVIKPAEKRYIGLTLSTAAFFMIFLFVVQWWANYESLLNIPISGHVADLMKQNECVEIEDSNPVSKLQIMIAMNLVNMVSDDCLNYQLDHNLWKNFSSEAPQIRALSYFGKFVTAKVKTEEEEYLKLACENSTEFEGCYLAKNIESVDSLKNPYNSPLIALIKYEKNKKDLADLEHWDQIKMVKKYILSERILALDLLNKPDQRQPASQRKSPVRLNELQEIARQLKDL